MGKRCLWGTIILLWLVGCGFNQTVEDTPVLASPTMIEIPPTFISNASIVPLATVTRPPESITLIPQEERIWEASPVLVNLYKGPGFFSEEWAWSRSSNLVIYRDGLVLTEKEIDLGGGLYARTLLQGQLEAQELCALLIQIEGDGIFEFDLSQYEEPMVTDMGHDTLVVRTWRTQAVRAYGLGVAVANHPIGNPYEGYAPGGLARAYQRLSEYVPPNAVPFEPERVQVWLFPLESTADNNSTPWEMEDVSLTRWMAEYGQANDWGRMEVAMELEGEVAQQFWSLLGNQRSSYFREDNVTYSVTIRPLFPYEQRDPHGRPWADSPEFDLTPRQKMDCSSG